MTCIMKWEGISTLSPSSCAQVKGPAGGLLFFFLKLVRIFFLRSTFSIILSYYILSYSNHFGFFSVLYRKVK